MNNNLHLNLNACRVYSKFTTCLTDADLKEVKSSCSLRRADRFTVLAAAAVLCSRGNPFPNAFATDTGLISVSSFGPHKTVFATLDDILDYPEDMILPVRFSHSVHNAALGYLGTILKLQGPAFAVTGFESPLFAALELASTLLQANMCPQVLLIGIEEQGLLTKAAPRLDNERYPTEPEEFVCAMLLSAEPHATSRALSLNKNITEPSAKSVCTLGLTQENISQLNDASNKDALQLQPINSNRTLDQSKHDITN